MRGGGEGRGLHRPTLLSRLFQRHTVFMETGLTRWLSHLFPPLLQARATKSPPSALATNLSPELDLWGVGFLGPQELWQEVGPPHVGDFTV